MKDKTFLMIPGPTPIPETVLLAMAKHPIGHRSGEFEAILKEVGYYCIDVLKLEATRSVSLSTTESDYVIIGDTIGIIKTFAKLFYEIVETVESVVIQPLYIRVFEEELTLTEYMIYILPAVGKRTVKFVRDVYTSIFTRGRV